MPEEYTERFVFGVVRTTSGGNVGLIFIMDGWTWLPCPHPMPEVYPEYQQHHTCFGCVLSCSTRGIQTISLSLSLSLSLVCVLTFRLDIHPPPAGLEPAIFGLEVRRLVH